MSRLSRAASVCLIVAVAAAASSGRAADDAAPALGGDAARPPALADLRAERRRAVSMLDTAWGQAVDALIARMGADPRAEAAWRALQRSQELWSAHRDADCLETAPALLDAPSGRRATLSCEIAKTRARALELADRYDLTLRDAPD